MQVPLVRLTRERAETRERLLRMAMMEVLDPSTWDTRVEPSPWVPGGWRVLLINLGMDYDTRVGWRRASALVGVHEGQAHVPRMKCWAHTQANINPDECYGLTPMEVLRDPTAICTPPADDQEHTS